MTVAPCAAASPMKPPLATLSGVAAIVLWSAAVALTRSLSETLGIYGAGAAIYATSGCLVWLAFGRPRVRGQSALYLWGCGGLFVVYGVSLALALGLAADRRQALDLGLINYLWPSLTLALAVPIHRLRVGWWLWPGVIVAFGGVAWATGGGLSLDGLAANIAGNPLAYALALTAAVAWALYSNLVRLADPKEGALALFLLASALVMAPMALLEPAPAVVSPATLGELAVMGASTALAYMGWDVAMKRGDATLVAVLSYFTPLLSVLISALWLDTTPTPSFWMGTGLVVAGSLLCWTASRRA
ncbi:aromatic amino acid DMT transporter YddG [Rhodospirillum rubrum]|uniref:EamA domain-containing protein n=1 Tax=Rhodospirillum rubrum (strain ATCC 11170 / ATH 1.1.1 / DSM 467 / LMG 4362 / NCIMB 8255 / S1) TaxID=269796 RepID=Q2RPU5_RHORT|nr:aromatic amino acid DMT transporter YddG [Rhodospirillum rubrum]ABC23850.1 Protein of unknown function DUF6, transmembrane [Rhodospirillum rubrum ATCC 11170]AEO49592.1 aromatic amino acid exporter [Rhodospirillum rubrum F11]MBK5955527.1 EamA family transporter [Rhodospirillum rubrum]QXG79797.1 aromatic amino acid DMT transporter YddG [Rhodospirillum rubrum]HAP98875.1 drug/metabolite DMT transporter permease [Rhodospirillum rubrum]